MSTLKNTKEFGNPHSELRDPGDFYETPRSFTREMLTIESFSRKVWEPTTGKGAISDVLSECGYHVYKTDIVERIKLNRALDFLSPDCARLKGKYDIVMNPPFKYFNDFVIKAFEMCNQKVAVVACLAILKSSGRYEKIFTKFPVKKVLVCPTLHTICAENRVIQSHFGHIWIIFDKQHDGATEMVWMKNVKHDGRNP